MLYGKFNLRKIAYPTINEWAIHNSLAKWSAAVQIQLVLRAAVQIQLVLRQTFAILLCSSRWVQMPLWPLTSVHVWCPSLSCSVRAVPSIYELKFDISIAVGCLLWFIEVSFSQLRNSTQILRNGFVYIYYHLWKISTQIIIECKIFALQWFPAMNSL